MTTLDQQIRMAHPGDSKAIAALSRDLIEHDLPWRWTASRVRSAIADKNTNCIVITHNKRLQAFSIVQFGHDEAHINLLAVLPERQGHGLGTRLLEWQTKVAQVGGIRRISLEVRRNNLRAMQFYEKLDFKPTGVLERYYSGLEDGVRMQRNL